MKKDYEKLFTHFIPREPSEDLFNKIMSRIQEEERLIYLKKRLFIFSVFVIVSTGAFIPVINIFKEEFIQSGFSQFLSLIVSDFGLVAVNWQDFGLTILESLPVMSMIVFLTTAFVFLWSLKHLVKVLRNFFPTLI